MIKSLLLKNPPEQPEEKGEGGRGELCICIFLLMYNQVKVFNALDRTFFLKSVN